MPELATGPAPAASRPAARGAGRLTALSELAAGAVARLERRDLSEGEACLLAAMGLTVGCRLLVRSAGDPCIVEVRATRIGLARTVAARLWVGADAPTRA